MNDSRILQMLAESGCPADDLDPLVRLLASLDADGPRAAAPVPSPELAALLGPAEPSAPVVHPLSVHARASVAGAVVLAIASVGATGLSAAANTLPAEVQHRVAEFSRDHLPFQFPEPGGSDEQPLGSQRPLTLEPPLDLPVAPPLPPPAGPSQREPRAVPPAPAPERGSGPEFEPAPTPRSQSTPDQADASATPSAPAPSAPPSATSSPSTAPETSEPSASSGPHPVPRAGLAAPPSVPPRPSPSEEADRDRQRDPQSDDRDRDRKRDRGPGKDKGGDQVKEPGGDRDGRERSAEDGQEAETPDQPRRSEVAADPTTSGSSDLPFLLFVP